MTRGAGVLTALAIALAAARAAAAPPDPDPAPPPAGETARRPAAPKPALWPRLSLHLGGAVATGASAFDGERRFTEFAEEGRLATDYSRQAGPGLDVGLDYAFSRHVGVSAAYTLQTRDVSASYESTLPHPLYLSRPRVVSGTLDSLAYTENAAHLSLLLRHQGARLRYGVFGGPSWASVKPDIVEPVQYRHAYPYDTVEVTGVPRVRQSGSGFGFNVGATLEYRVSSRLAAEGMLRYYGFTPDLPESAGTVELDGGGVLAGLALRIFVN